MIRALVGDGADPQLRPLELPAVRVVIELLGAAGRALLVDENEVISFDAECRRLEVAVGGAVDREVGPAGRAAGVADAQRPLELAELRRRVRRDVGLLQRGGVRAEESGWDAGSLRLGRRFGRCGLAATGRANEDEQGGD